MSNNSDFAATMYESDPVVAALNKVPGFDPLKLMNRRRNPGAEKGEKDLDFRYKKLWFRLAHRQGRIRLNKLSVTEQIAIFEAQVYLEPTDTDPVSSFTATCTREEGGRKYIEGAQIKAMDQALTDAGFGLQFVPAPIGGTENAAAQAAAGPTANVQTTVMAPGVVPASDGTAGSAKVSTAAPKTVQQTVQQRQQTAVQQRTTVPQATVQQKPVVSQPTAPQHTATSQSAVQRPAPQQRAMTQQAGMQQNPVTARPVVQQATVQQGQTAPQPVSRQRPAPVQQQSVTPQAAFALVQNPAAVAAPASQPVVKQTVGAVALPSEPLPVSAEKQELPVGSDMAAAMTMLSGRKESTQPIAQSGTKAEEKAETTPEGLPVLPTAETSAVPGSITSAGQDAKEDKPYTETTPVEEILKVMTLEDAEKVVVPSGTCKGWTLKEVAERRRPSLKFYVSEGYQGKDNILRAAARLLLNDLEVKAS